MWFQCHSGKQSSFSLGFFSCYFRKRLGYARGLLARNGVSIGYDVSAVWPDFTSVFSFSWKFTSRLRVCCEDEKYDWAGSILERRPKAWNSGSGFGHCSVSRLRIYLEARHGVVDLVISYYHTYGHQADGRACTRTDYSHPFLNDKAVPYV